MPRLAATLAGLALVAVPSAIAMANTDTASHAAKQQTLNMRQMIRSAPQMNFRGHHCHHMPGDQQNGTSSGTSGV